MTNRTLRLGTRLRPTDSPSQVYRQIARATASTEVMIAFGAGIARELRQELHSWERVGAWMLEVATETGKPVLLNVEQGDESETLAIAPKGWSEERLQGYIAACHEELEEAFGEIDRTRDPLKGGVA